MAAALYLSSSGSVLNPLELVPAFDHVSQDGDILAPESRIDARPNVLAHVRVSERAQDFVNDPRDSTNSNAASRRNSSTI
jgi:hypothetical protein